MTEQETKDERKTRIYTAFKDMRETMGKSYPEFNDRTLVQFLDDSQKRANGYVTSRDAQGKEPWQSNVFTTFTRNKIKAHIASVAKIVPQVSITAVNESNQLSFKRADVMRDLVKASYTEKGANPEKVILNDSWNCSINGAVIKYDGYSKKVAKQKDILLFDQVTGNIKLGEEKEVIIEDKCVEFNVPVQNLFIRNAYITDIQAQPDLIWFSTYNSKEAFLAEWSGYTAAEEVQEAHYLERGDIETFFGEKQSDITGIRRGKIDVLRYYNKLKNEYIVFANGVEIFFSPLLWGRNKKLYPFAKTVFENFSNSNFFWGNSLPNILMGDQDVANSFINLMVDKTYRSLNSPMLIDVNNRDAFALEDEYVTGDTKIYVNNVDGVKPMPQNGVSAADFQMLDKIVRGLDTASTDAVQQGVSGSGSTAREIVIANERADEVKGLFYTQLKDLWVQKNVLRVQTILLQYSNLKKVTLIVGEAKRDIFKNQFNLNNTTLSDGTQGILQIDVFEGKESFPNQRELDTQEFQARLMGKNMEVMAITADYLDNFEYYIQIESESFRQKNRALDMALATEKLQTTVSIFPEIFQANKNEFFRKFMIQHGDDPETYLRNMQEQETSPQIPQGMPNLSTPLQKQMSQPEQSLGVLTATNF